MALLESRVAVVTGAGTGIGRVLALACAREGARVVAAGRFGGVDVLVNNAAVFGERRTFDQIGEADWDRTLAVNLKGAWLCARAAAPHMRRGGWGRIVNMSSDTVLSGMPGLLQERRAIRRAETPDDVAGTLLYLASPLADFVTGQLIAVNGGYAYH